MTKKTFLTIVVAFILLLTLTTNGQKPRAASLANDFILHWSTDTYTPPDYQGKALPTRGSKIKAVATPTKKLSVNPDALFYRWLLDDEIMGQAGQGKSVFEFTADKWPGGYHEVESQILDARENIIWRGTVSIKIVNPEVLIRQPNNAYSAKDKLTTKTGLDLELKAAPLFFNIGQINELSFDWRVDNVNLSWSEEKNPESLKLKIPQANLSSVLTKNLSLVVFRKIDQLQRVLLDLNIEIQ